MVAAPQVRGSNHVNPELLACQRGGQLKNIVLLAMIREEILRHQNSRVVPAHEGAQDAPRLCNEPIEEPDRVVKTREPDSLTLMWQFEDRRRRRRLPSRTSRYVHLQLGRAGKNLLSHVGGEAVRCPRSSGGNQNPSAWGKQTI